MAVEPHDSVKPLVYVARLTHSEKNALFAFADAFPGLDVGGVFQKRVTDVTLDRLCMAEGILQTAQAQFRAAAQQDELRCVINRGYYAIHHAIRSMVLHHNKVEADGHQEAITELRDLLKGASVQRACGLELSVIKEIAKARDNRSVADYSPYPFSRREGTTEWIEITGRTWTSAAKFNVALAERIVLAAFKFVGL